MKSTDSKFDEKSIKMPEKHLLVYAHSLKQLSIDNYNPCFVLAKQNGREVYIM